LIAQNHILAGISKVTDEEQFQFSYDDNPSFSCQNLPYIN